MFGLSMHTSYTLSVGHPHCQTTTGRLFDYEYQSAIRQNSWTMNPGHSAGSFTKIHGGIMKSITSGEERHPIRIPTCLRKIPANQFSDIKSDDDIPAVVHRFCRICPPATIYGHDPCPHDRMAVEVHSLHSSGVSSHTQGILSILASEVTKEKFAPSSDTQTYKSC
ncbi:hypothetical protein VTN00DRAFT_4067 [Thermoascus crustaceus]|uniref:uncharacterized protein n=1 Tax=Thermoascus crustaceus TaxID=5088 RepID=UPI0037444EDC